MEVMFPFGPVPAVANSTLIRPTHLNHKDVKPHEAPRGSQTCPEVHQGYA